MSGDPECSFGGTDSAFSVNKSKIGSVFREQQLTYFCGHALACRQVGSRQALAQAKRNVEKFYAVVGILEEFEGTLRVMEMVLPMFLSVSRSNCFNL